MGVLIPPPVRLLLMPPRALQPQTSMDINAVSTRMETALMLLIRSAGRHGRAPPRGTRRGSCLWRLCRGLPQIHQPRVRDMVLHQEGHEIDGARSRVQHGAVRRGHQLR